MMSRFEVRSNSPIRSTRKLPILALGASVTDNSGDCRAVPIDIGAGPGSACTVVPSEINARSSTSLNPPNRDEILRFHYPKWQFGLLARFRSRSPIRASSKEIQVFTGQEFNGGRSR